jgi:DNA replication protein DnaC
MIKNSLLLYGRVGSGKTHLAVAALKKMMDMGLDGRFWNVNDLFREMRAKFGEGQGDETLLDDLMECDVLVLDDLGTHRSTDFVLDRLYLIINQRYEAMKPIIVTTNLELGQLYEEFEERIGSRLNEMCFLVSFMGEDFRMRAVEKQRKL